MPVHVSSTSSSLSAPSCDVPVHDSSTSSSLLYICSLRSIWCSVSRLCSSLVLEILGPSHRRAWTLAVIEVLLILLNYFRLTELDRSLVEWANKFAASRKGDLTHRLRIHPRVLAHLVSSNMSLAKWRCWSDATDTSPADNATDRHRSVTGGEAIQSLVIDLKVVFVQRQWWNS